MPPFLAPYLPLIWLALAIGLFGSGVSVGYKWDEGLHARKEVVIANAYLEAAGRNAAVESAEALAVAKAAEKRRASSAATKHLIELELARDETAHTCRVSDGTFRVLNDAIDANNGAPSKAGPGDGAKPPVPEAGKPNSGGSGSGIKGWFGSLWPVSGRQANPDRVD